MSIDGGLSHLQAWSKNLWQILANQCNIAMPLLSGLVLLSWLLGNLLLHQSLPDFPWLQVSAGGCCVLAGVAWWVWHWVATTRSAPIEEPSEHPSIADSMPSQVHLLDSMEHAVIATDLEGRITYWNPFAARLYGQSAAEVLGAEMVSVALVQTSHTQTSEVLLCVQQHQRWSGEFLINRQDGIQFPAFVTIAPIHTATGQITGMVASVFDLSETQRIEEALWQANADLGITVEAQTRNLGSAIEQLRQEIARRKQVEQTLQLQSEREQFLWTISQHIRQSLDLTNVLQTTTAEVHSFLQTDRVVIFQFDRTWIGRVVAESVKPQWQAMLGQSIFDPCFAENYASLYRQGRVKTIDNIATAKLAACHVRLLQRHQVQANLVVPILQNDELWGLLIAHQCSSSRHWRSWEITFLQQLATQVSIAIQQSELYGQVQQLNTTLEKQIQARTAELQRSLDFEALLKRITDKVRDSLNEDQILQTAVEELTYGIGVECCSAALYNADQTTLTIQYEHNLSLPPAQGKTLQIANTLEPQIYTQLAQAECCQFCFVVSNPLRPTSEQYTILACPLFDDQQPLGDLWLFKPCHETFEELEIRLVQQVANQCAIALRQARLYQAAQRQVEELERLNLLKDDFLSTVSHELRTPVSNIKMASQMLEILLLKEGDAKQDPAASVMLQTVPLQTVSRYLQILQDECERETSLINDVLDLSRLDADTDPLILNAITLNSWIAHLVEPFEARARSHHQHLKLDIASDLPPMVTDLVYLERILTELVHNACKYTPAGETILITAQTLEREATRFKELLPDVNACAYCPFFFQISVSNSGVEIPAKELVHVFDKFYRVPSNDPWKHGGTGLGLALVKKRVEHLQGTIAVTSQQGVTTFTLEIPQMSL